MDTSKTQANLLSKRKPIVRLNFNPEKNFGKETPIELCKVAEEILHSNSIIKILHSNSIINQQIVLPAIYHDESIILMPLCIKCLLYVRKFTYILLLNFFTSLKGR